MSITLTISRSGLKLSRYRAAIEGSELENEKPDIASLENFASEVRFFQRHQRKALETTSTNSTQHTDRALDGDITSERQATTKDGKSARLEEAFPPASSPPLDGPPGGSSTLRPITSTPHAAPSHPAGIAPLLTNVDSFNSNASNEEDHSTDSCPSLRTPSGTTTTVATSTTGVESVHTDSAKPDSAHGEDVGEFSRAQQNANGDQTKPFPPVVQHAIQTSIPAIGYSNISSKGGKAVRSSRWKPDKIYMPRGKLDRLRKIRIAGPETIKIEDAVFSAAHTEKLRKFLSVLGSKKDQIELFGKELPLCRAYLIQIAEGTANPAPYICIQGLRSAVDITRIHSAMSHKRYRVFYDPLRLCYETSNLSHIWNSELPEASQSSSYSMSGGASGFPLGFLNPIPQSQPQLPLNTDTRPLYEYLPVANNRTYCGALSRTLANGKTYLSTFGGLVEVDDMTCLMTCQHGFYEPLALTVPSLSDALAESDIPSNVECPLVFYSRDTVSDPTQADQSDAETRFASLETFGELGWRSLSIEGTIRMGREWCLVPMKGHPLLPNFIEGPGSKKGKSNNEPEIFYLDQITEPQPGHTTCISYPSCSGIISRNTSFLFGGGTDGILEVWTVLIAGEQGLQRGDSGSWVLDTSNPLQYKVIGSAIAMSHGAAHFVRLQDQFFEMIGDVMDSSRVSLAPVFRSLTQCAHMAFRLGDFHSADWFIEQALSRRALEQMHNGWYLPTIKAILGIIDGDGNTTSKDSSLPRSIVENLGSILLRYGTEILDATVLSHEWLEEHDPDLQSGERQILGKLLVAAAESLDKRKLNQPIKLSEILPNHNSESMKHTSVLKEGVGADVEGAAREASRFLPKKKNSFVILLIFLKISLTLIFASISGIAAAMILRDTEEGNQNSFFHVGTTKAVSVGAGLGPIFTGPLLFLSILIGYTFFFERLSSLSQINPRMVQFAKSLLVIVLVFARSTLVALYLARSLNVVDTRSLIVSSTAAAAPMMVSMGLHYVYWIFGPWSEPNSKNSQSVSNEVVACLVIWLIETGFDAIAGYTFGKVTQNQGLNIIQTRSSAASFGVLGALTHFWSVFYGFGERALCRRLAYHVPQSAADNASMGEDPYPIETKEQPMNRSPPDKSV